ncbi:hypothetical protein AMJ80_03615 [bacterium SM23_31]|nr:MAG: hypothetical protein AMJ80_03615 [bacterium SM23_31]
MKTKFILYIFTFISFLLISLYLSYLPSYARQEKSEADVTILVLMTGNWEEFREILYGFENVLQDSGIEYNIILKDSINDEISDEDLLNEINRDNPDLIFSIGSRTHSIIHYIKDIPVVFSTYLKPNVNNSEVQGTEYDNITGVTFFVPVIEQFTIYKEIIPRLRTIGVIHNSDQNKDLITEAQQAAKLLNIQLFEGEPRTLNNLIRVVDAFWIIVENTSTSHESNKRIIREGTLNYIPVMAPDKKFVSAGAPFAICADFPDIGRQSGDMAVKILQGIHPSLIPIETPQKSNIYINEKTIESIGLEISDNIMKNLIIISKTGK